MHATIPPPANAIAAVTHSEPWAWYTAQRRERPFVFDATLGVWIASSAEAVVAVLECTQLGVRPPAEPVPTVLLGGPLGDLFPHLARMSDDPTQQATKAAIVAALQAVDLDALAGHARRWAAMLPPEQVPFDLSSHALGSLCGVPDVALPNLSRAVRAFVVALAPGSSPVKVADGHTAVETLAALLTPCSVLPASPLSVLTQHLHVGVHDDVPLAPAAPAALASLANSIALLQQASDATAGLIGLALERHLASGETDASTLVDAVLRLAPPVHNTRRWAHADVTLLGQQLRRGDGVLVLLAAASGDPAAPDELPLAFGRGAHACPASAHTRVIAQAAVERLLTPDADGHLPLHPVADPALRYEPLPNARIPRLLRLSRTSGRKAAGACERQQIERSQP